MLVQECIEKKWRAKGENREGDPVDGLPFWFVVIESYNAWREYNVHHYG